MLSIKYAAQARWRPLYGHRHMMLTDNGVGKAPPDERGGEIFRPGILTGLNEITCDGASTRGVYVLPDILPLMRVSPVNDIEVPIF
jgi:hypothetical protein